MFDTIFRIPDSSFLLSAVYDTRRFCTAAKNALKMIMQEAVLMSLLNGPHDAKIFCASNSKMHWIVYLLHTGYAGICVSILCHDRISYIVTRTMDVRQLLEFAVCCHINMLEIAVIKHNFRIEVL